MTIELAALRFEALDPARLASFWAELLRWDVEGRDHGEVMVAPQDGAGYPLRFTRSDTAKRAQNLIHLDVTSESADDQRELVARALRLGGRHADVGQSGDEGHVVLADPEGNELCVIEPESRFLAGCGRVGAINCDGTRALGYFWAAALEWPLVWDQDEETAIQSPRGGSKITWSGPPLMPRDGVRHIGLDVVPEPGRDMPSEVQRLVELGARRADAAPTQDGGVVLLDPDGNPFRALPRP